MLCGRSLLVEAGTVRLCVGPRFSTVAFRIGGHYSAGFITYRKEAEGGFLFNPYLMYDLPLDDNECGVVELCDGRMPAAVMAVELARRFRTDRDSAERRLEETLSKLSGYFALRWIGTGKGQAPVVGQQTENVHRQGSECSIQEPMAGCLSSPLSVLWEITHACNLACVHCLSACGEPAPGELTTAEAKSLIDELASLRVFWFTLGGGEPLVRDDIYRLIDHATQRDLCVRLTTNGYAVTEDTLRRLEDLNVFSVQVSVDGLRETHDRIRGRAGAFDRAIRALELFREAECATLVTVSVNAQNIAEVPNLVSELAGIGVSSVKIVFRRMHLA